MYEYLTLQLVNVGGSLSTGNQNTINVQLSCPEETERLIAWEKETMSDVYAQCCAKLLKILDLALSPNEDKC